MKLIRRVRKLEAQVSADAFAQLASVVPITGVVWTRHESQVELPEPGPGEHVVEDLVLEEGGAADRGCTLRRISADANDLGVVYNSQVSRIGRVIARKGGGRVIEWE